VIALLAAGCALLVAAALWEVIGERGEAAASRLRRGLRRRTRALTGSADLPFPLAGGIEARIHQAALGEHLNPAAVLAAKVAATVLSIPLALTAAPAAPGRLSSIVAIGVPAAAFLAPDLLLDRVARTRRQRIAAALPDALDLMATGAASGRGAAALLAEGLRGSTGPLREELAQTVAAVECGISQHDALRAMREGAGGNLAAVAATLERSRRHGTPLSRALYEQASTLRGDGRRAIGERAARAAPKMQLVVALLLVPSVLLIVAAAIIANSGGLLPSY
jgi:tight adherence protein C